MKAGSDYASGLGIPCRRVDIVANGMGHRIAVCNGTQGWYVSDPVFDTAF
ncbi:MAG: hypothetical protein MJ061_03445 [Mailhella sp.]|nr:hypothetical protein [Mailhella sp.]